MKKHAARFLIAVLSVATVVGCDAPPSETPAPDPLLQPSATDLARPAPDSFRVKFQTTEGPFVVMAHRDWAPHGVDRFYYLVTNSFYDSTAFFRTVTDFVTQFGIAGTPRVNRVWEDMAIPDDSTRHGNYRGVMSFASGGPKTRTTQLFINLRDNRRLDTMGGFGYPPIAEVVEGMSVVDSLYAGYGEGAPAGNGPRQERIGAEGNAYLTRDFPELDYILTTTVEREWR